MESFFALLIIGGIIWLVMSLSRQSRADQLEYRIALLEQQVHQLRQLLDQNAQQRSADSPGVPDWLVGMGQTPSSPPQPVYIPPAQYEPGPIAAPAAPITPEPVEAPEPAVVLPSMPQPEPAAVVPGIPALPPVAAPEMTGPVFATTPEEPQLQPAQLRAVEQAPVQHHSRSRAEWESLIGGKLLNRIGALALIIAMGFFLKYAFDSGWVTETMQVIIGLVIGGGLFGLAHRTHRKGFEIFAQGLVGAGTAILYLSVYAAFNFYHLITQPTAFVMMSLVTAIAIVQGVRYDSLAVGLLGWLGGFLTPFMLSTGAGNTVGLFSYILLLDLGLLGVSAWKRSWRPIEPLTLLATYYIYAIWIISPFDDYAFGLGFLFLTSFWLLFVALYFWRVVQRAAEPVSAMALHQLVFGANSLFFSGLLLGLLDDFHPAWRGAALALVAGFYLLTTVGVRLLRPDGERLHAQQALTGIVLAVLAAWFEWSGFALVAAWSLLALALVAVGTRLRLWYLWRPGLAVVTLAYLGLLSTRGALAYSPLEEYTLLLNTRALTVGVLLAVIALSNWLLRISGVAVDRWTRHALQYSWFALCFGLISVEASDVTRQLMLSRPAGEQSAIGFYAAMIIPMLWCGYALALFAGARRFRATTALVSGVVVTGLAALVIAFVGLSFGPIQDFIVLLNIRALAFAVVLALIAGVWVASRSERRGWLQSKHVSPIVQLILMGLAFELVTVETRDFFQQQIALRPASSEDQLQYLKLLTSAVVWCGYALALFAFGARRRMQMVLFGGVAVAGLATLVTAAFGFTYVPLADFIPLVNARAFTFTVLIAMIGGVWVASREQRRGWASNKDLSPIVQVLLVLLVFELLSVETRDFFGRQLLTMQGGEIERIQNLQQLALSIVWLVYSITLLIFGIWQRRVAPRLTAIALFGLTILKIFFFDLSFLETLYRIFSFMGLGVILLAVSYLYQRFKDLIFEQQEQPA